MLVCNWRHAWGGANAAPTLTPSQVCLLHCLMPVLLVSVVAIFYWSKPQGSVSSQCFRPVLQASASGQCFRQGMQLAHCYRFAMQVER